MGSIVSTRSVGEDGRGAGEYQPFSTEPASPSIVSRMSPGTLRNTESWVTNGTPSRTAVAAIQRFASWGRWASA